MKITIFGGGGFIGSAVVDRLLQDGHELKILERPGVMPHRSFLGGESVEWVTGDFTKIGDASAVIIGADIVLHLVSTTLPKSSNENPMYDIQTNLLGTVRILDAMVKNNVPKIIFISSGGTVYGQPVELPINEEHPTNPKVSYGIVKLAIEKYLLLYRDLYNLNVNILRVANPYGTRQKIDTSQGAIAVFLNNAINKRPITIWGDGNSKRDYIYITDVAEALALTVAYKGGCPILNIGSGAGLSLNQLVQCIENVFGFELKVTKESSRPFDVQDNILDNSLARKELGWEPRVSIESGLRMTAEWIKRSQN